MDQFMILLYLSPMRAAKAKMSLHICAVSPQPLLLALKKEKVQAKLYGPVHDTFVFIAYASSEGLDEPAHLRSVTTAFAARTEKREDM